MFESRLLLVASVIACYICAVLGDDTEDIMSHLKVYNISLGSSFLPGQQNWRPNNEWAPLTTRLFNAPLPGGDLLVGWSDADAVGHVSYLKKDEEEGYILEKTVDIAGKELRGLVALKDSSFGVLAFLRSDDYTKTRIFVQKWSAMKASGKPKMAFETELANSGNFPQDFHIGDSRMELDSNNGYFYAYYHVHNTGGHEGDTYFKVNVETGEWTRLWSWGCSHSMSELLSFHPLLNTTLSLCVTDCYPGTSGEFSTDAVGGLYTEDRYLLQRMAGGCNGCVGGEVGMVAPLYDGGWVVIFNSHSNDVGKGQAACRSSYNQDVGVVFVGTDKTLSGSTIWLTNTPEDELDPALARYGAFCGNGTCQDGQDSQEFLIGWKQGSDRYFAIMDNTGAIKKGPVNASYIVTGNITSAISWGARDDTWRTLDDGSVAWLEVPGTARNPEDVLRVYVMQYGVSYAATVCPCALALILCLVLAFFF